MCASMYTIRASTSEPSKPPGSSACRELAGDPMSFCVSEVRAHAAGVGSTATSSHVSHSTSYCVLRPASFSFSFSFLMLHVAPISPRPGSDRFLQPSATGTDWGEYDLRSQKERAEAFEDYELRRRRESLFWAPPGGESLAQVVQRVVRPREPNVTARP